MSGLRPLSEIMPDVLAALLACASSPSPPVPEEQHGGHGTHALGRFTQARGYFAQGPLPEGERPNV